MYLLAHEMYLILLCIITVLNFMKCFVDEIPL